MRCGRSVAYVLLSLSIGGCFTWRLESATIPQVFRDEAPRAVRVTKTDGGVVALQDPELRGDSILAIEEEFLRETRTVVPLSEVAQLEVRRLDTARTVVAAVVVSAVAIGGVRWIWSEIEDWIGAGGPDNWSLAGVAPRTD